MEVEDKYKYFDRDSSWLSFNYRVLKEAEDESLPLYERIKFLAIYSSNLDEFFRVRMANLKRIRRIGKRKINAELDIRPKKLLKDLQKIVKYHLSEYGDIFQKDIIPELKKNDIFVYWDEEIKPEHWPAVRKHFRSKVLTFLRPVIVTDSNINEVFLVNRALYFILLLRKKGDDEGKEYFAYLNIPSDNLPRYIQVPSIGDKHYIISLDDIIRHHLGFIFPEYEVIEKKSIKLNRDADLYIEDEFAGDLVQKIKDQLDKRNIGIPARFLYDKSISEKLLKLASDIFSIDEDDLIAGGRYHNMSDLMKLPNPLKPKLESKSPPDLVRKELETPLTIFDSIDERDIILHFPYISYDYVLKFFNEAAIDPFVSEIKVTLYRIASQSFVANALISAVKNGKRVTVFVEVKARFDEENNLIWAQKMEEAGIRIIYSIPGLKVHAKIALVKRRVNDVEKTYSFLGTGNFNEVTAGIYADHGLMTCHSEMNEEIDSVFTYLYRRDEPTEFKHVLVSQFNMIDRFIEMVNREIKHAEEGKDAHIIVKVNNLENRTMIDKLYEANEAGVKIDLIARSICCLVPGVIGLSENIRTIRIVDGFLEHARVWVFHNNGSNDTYMGSADWMNRNLLSRIEVVYPLYNEEIKKEMLQILKFQIQDNTKACLIDEDGANIPIIRKKGARRVRAQHNTYQWLQRKLS
ncbi:MAG: polyphosphate kinase 1 [Bacteroidota bacterium]